MTAFDPPAHIKYILRRLTDCGHAAFLIGGCVRDSIIGRSVHDWDVASSATPAEVSAIFDKTLLTGERFGGVTVVLPDGAVEVTAFRAERDYRDGRRPDNVEFVSNLNEDLSRRDFTINSMAVSLTGELVDPFGGRADIENRLIRCVGAPDARFNEDALRMFRALRLSAELGFDIEKDTLSSVYANAGRARLISAERVRAELERTLLSANPRIAGEMIDSGLLAKFLKPTHRCAPASLGLERLSALPARPAPRWCAFCVILFDAGLIGNVEVFLRDMRLDNRTVKLCAAVSSVKEFREFTDFKEDGAGIKRLLAKHGTDATLCAAAVYDALQGRAQPTDAQPTDAPQPNAPQPNAPPPDAPPPDAPPPVLARVEEIVKSGECFTLGDLAVTGNDLIALGYRPGRELGETLARLLAHVLERPEDNTRDTLLQILKKNCGF